MSKYENEQLPEEILVYRDSVGLMSAVEPHTGYTGNCERYVKKDVFTSEDIELLDIAIKSKMEDYNIDVNYPSVYGKFKSLREKINSL